MEIKDYDKDLFDFFSKLIEDEEEIDILQKIMGGVEFEEIIENYIDSIRLLEND